MLNYKILSIYKQLFIALLVVRFEVTSTFNIVNMMTDEEFYRTFHSDRNQVLEHDFVKLKVIPDVQFKGRLSARNRVLSFNAFGRRYDLQLTARDNVLLGKNTPIWHVQSNPANVSQTQYTLLNNILDNVTGIYEDPVNMVSVMESKYHDTGDVFYCGMIAEDLAISPLPQRLIKAMSSTGATNGAKDHVIFKVATENSTYDFTSDAIDTTRMQNAKRPTRLQPLSILYPEILLVIDASFYQHLGRQPYFAMNYLAPFWNGVDLRYRLLRSPQVKLNIAGVILAQDDAALRFIKNNLDELGRIHAKQALLDAGEYFYKMSKVITSKDVVVIMTKRDICSLKYSSYCKSSTLGKAFTGKACSKKKNTAILEDNGGYAGIITATHEIGHLLGLPHDGDGDAEDCSITDGYIMASAKYRSINSLYWSPCSKSILQEFASLTASNCLENKPNNFGHLLSPILPGKVLTLEEQCFARGGLPCMYNATVCWKLHCTKSMTNMRCIGKAPAAEGSPCGEGLYCRNGVCIAETPTLLPNNL